MCGIYGFYGNEDLELLKEFQQDLINRGPDAQGIRSFKYASVGMNRLHLRGDKGSEVPFTITEKTIGYNGEIYGGIDPQFSFTAHKGGGVEEMEFLQDVTHKLAIDGMYAYAEYDSLHESLTLGRDRFGIKPLFYRNDEKSTLFSSCVRSFFTHSKAKAPEVNTGALFDVFAYGHSLNEETVYSGISEVLPGTELHITEAGKTEVKSSVLQKIEVPVSDALHIQKALRRSIQSCIQGDYKIGVAISGGIDSTILAHELNAMGVEGIETFSVYIAETGDGIRDLRELGLPERGSWQTWKHHSVEIGVENFTTNLLESLDQYFYPTDMHSVPLYAALAKLVEARGIRVLLTGEGADEYFMGYERYVSYDGPKDVENYYLGGLKGEFLRRIFQATTVQAGIQRGEAFNTGDFWRTIRNLEIKGRLQKLLLRTDVILMEHRIEGRTPFLHGGLPEMALLTDPEILRGSAGKEALRTAFAHSIKGLADKPKKRFKAPDDLFWTVLNDPRIKELLFRKVDIPCISLPDTLIEEMYARYHEAPGEMSELLYLVMTTKHSFLKSYETI